MLPMHQKNCDCGCNHEHSHNHSADAFFDVWGVETPKMFEQEELSSKLHDLGNEKVLGRILRGKGILQTDNNTWVQFDYVPGECDVKPSAADYTGRLCIIGKDLNTIELCRLFGISA
jgi:G3E family GTPase